VITLCDIWFLCIAQVYALYASRSVSIVYGKTEAEAFYGGDTEGDSPSRGTVHSWTVFAVGFKSQSATIVGCVRQEFK
jgi:hypothetical protein